MRRNHYETLQIRPDAEQEVVDAVYRRLCRKYHPDVNADKSAVRRMHQITEAYSVLGDPEKRRLYDAQLAHEPKAPVTRAAAVADEVQQPELVLSRYFDHVRDQQWHKAYLLLTAEDRGRISLADFIDWQEAVCALYAIGDMRVSVFRTHRDASGPVTVDLLAEGMEIDLKQDVARAVSTLKTVHRENGAWRVRLGYEDVRGFAARFRLLAETRHPRVVGRDTLMEMAEEEAYRTRRFGHPLSLVAFAPIQPRSEEHAGLWQERTLRWMAVASNHLRRTDRLCWLEGEAGVLLLPDTTLRQAHVAARKWEESLRAIAAEEMTPLSVVWCASDYTGLAVTDWFELLMNSLHRKQAQRADSPPATPD